MKASCESEPQSVEGIIAKYGTKAVKLIAVKGFEWWWENRRVIAGKRWRRKEMEARQRLNVKAMLKARKKAESIEKRIEQ